MARLGGALDQPLIRCTTPNKFNEARTHRDKHTASMGGTNTFIMDDLPQWVTVQGLKRAFNWCSSGGVSTTNIFIRLGGSALSGAVADERISRNVGRARAEAPGHLTCCLYGPHDPQVCSASISHRSSDEFALTPLILMTMQLSWRLVHYPQTLTEPGKRKLGIRMIPRVSLSRHIHSSLHQPYKTPREAFLRSVLVERPPIHAINSKLHHLKNALGTGRQKRNSLGDILGVASKFMIMVKIATASHAKSMGKIMIMG
ncbi:hypothetical protein An02g11100 [Aspergillus niger]|uniref:Uncharacterized protein n=2 Tax=Aspergillus niger TaxID=5061 RepID=A2QEH6_ASPNC|nr:hypothetical protein An02g11100 [Aspergillus niger]CAK48775.1 hypothetical protein An02g11100 [Aspergillus niger]